MATLGIQRRPRSEGFTLLEIVITLGILSVGLLALAVMQLEAMRGGYTGRHTTEGDAIARTQVEQAERQPWATLAPTGGWVAPPWLPGGTVTHQVKDSSSTYDEMVYTVRWRTTDLATADLRSVDVQVTWSEPRRPNRSIVISTVRPNLGW
jgi:type IV pilus assembly protein PilV